MYPAYELLAYLFLWDYERELRNRRRVDTNPGTSTGNDEPLRPILGSTFADLRAMISRLAHVYHRPAH
jgi:hypothetical protein